MVVQNKKDGNIVDPPSLFPDGSAPATPRNPSTFSWVSKRWRPFVLPILLLATAAAALGVDYPLARWCVEGNCPSLLGDLFDVVEPFGNGLGVVVIVMLIYQLDPLRRWALPRVLATSLGAGLAADVVKLLIARQRPHGVDFHGTVWDTFGQCFPFLSAGSGGQSFPSAHTATAIGLAAALIWLYPRGRWLFATLAVLVACQRLDTGAHYLSDTFCGAAVGCLVAVACLERGRLPALFDQLEHRLRMRRSRRLESLLGPVQNEQLTLEPTGEDSRRRAA